jgi:hypothetical protein
LNVGAAPEAPTRHTHDLLRRTVERIERKRSGQFGHRTGGQFEDYINVMGQSRLAVVYTGAIEPVTM